MKRWYDFVMLITGLGGSSNSYSDISRADFYALSKTTYCNFSPPAAIEV